MTIEITDWAHCYDEHWGDSLVPSAYAHPAKVAPGLSRRIYDHCFEMGWLKEGSVVLDPFAGIGGFALQAILHGCNFVGCELEPKFVELAQQNIALWERQYAAWPKLGIAIVIQGDSRKLGEVLQNWQAEIVVSSPPYVDQMSTNREGTATGDDHFDISYGQSPGQLGVMRAGSVDTAVSSPPFASSIGSDDPGKRGGLFRDPKRHNDVNLTGTYGETEGQLGAMSNGDIDAIVTSPPYISGGHHPDQTGAWKVSTPGYGAPSKELAGYGDTDGQMGRMQEGDIDIAISSPPYEASLSTERSGIDWSKVNQGDGKIRDFTSEPYQKYRPGAGGEMRYGQSEGQLGQMRGGLDGAISSPPYEQAPRAGKDIYTERALYPYDPRYQGDSKGQLSSETGETFWSAAKTIIEQCYQVLKPGAVAIWTLKAFVRNGRIVDFPDQWRQLCEHCGFETLHIHRAWLVEEQGTQLGLFGEDKQIGKARLSFFRRLHMKKYPHLAIKYEIVLCTRKRDRN